VKVFVLGAPKLAFKWTLGVIKYGGVAKAKVWIESRGT
jgi:hypothetical protein